MEKLKFMLIGPKGQGRWVALGFWSLFAALMVAVYFIARGAA